MPFLRPPVRVISLLLAVGMLGALLAALPSGGADEPPAAPGGRTGAAWLEVVIDTLAPVRDDAALARQVAALERESAARPGFLACDAARLDGDGGARLLRTVEWDGVEACEAASLAADGGPAQAALLGSVVGERRVTLYARRLREQVNAKEPAGHLEVTIFRTRPGTTREAHLARFDAGEQDFAKAQGLLGHSLWIAPDGRWVHLVRWRSEADFRTTGAALMKTAGVGGWIRSLDYQRFSVLRGDRLAR